MEITNGGIERFLWEFANDICSYHSRSQRNTRRKVILIEGPAGSGKTTLMWYTCRKWAASRLFPEVNLLIHISLKDPAFHSAKCLADIIPHPSSEMREAVARAIANQHGKGICFLFDSWDEVPCHCLELNPYLHCFIAGTSGKMVPRCSIVVTSRPVGALPLYPLLTARLIVGCFGYSEIEKFIDANLDGIGDTKENLLEAFRRNPRLVGLCNLPINAAIVIHLFNSFNHKLPLTRTELFMALVSNILVRHMQLRTLHGLQGVPSFDSLPEDIYQKLNQVCSLAFHGVMESRSVFGVKALKAVGVASHIVLDTLGLLQVHQQLTGFGPQHRYSFLHYAVQEFLAAYHISKLTSEEQFKVVSQIFHNNPLSPVLPFYAGLTKLSNSSVCSMLMEVTKKPLDMGSAMVSMLQNPTGSKFSNSNKLLLVLVNCIYESQRKDVCKLVDFPHAPLNPSCYVSFQGLRLDPMYCMSLGYFLANKQLDKICTLVLNDCCIGDIGIEVFMKELSQGRVLKEATGVKLVLSGNDCSRHSVKYISETMSQTPMLWGLHFMGWILFGLDTAVLLKYLIEGVCKRSARCRCIALSRCVSYKHIYHLTLLIVFGNLLILNLSYNDIGRSSVMSLLMQSLKHSRKLVTLHMNDCNISDGGLQHLGSALQDHETVLQLAIADNPFSSEALTFFLEKLCTVRSRLLYFQVESQRCKPAHYRIVQRINHQRLVPLEIQELKKGPIESLVPSFFKALTMQKYHTQVHN